MMMYSSRRQFIKLGMFFGISVMIGRLPDAHALEVHSGPSPLDWMSPDGKVRYRWDALRKVTGQKTFARDFRTRSVRLAQGAGPRILHQGNAGRPDIRGRGLEPSGAEIAARPPRPA